MPVSAAAGTVVNTIDFHAGDRPAITSTIAPGSIPILHLEIQQVDLFLVGGAAPVRRPRSPPGRKSAGRSNQSTIGA
ncbi:MAG: hypothetical protein DMF84_23485 [Acidobacteria bacterium]|nr:MAG: hypothetical protein DMF84_23485 [Acidobacteriota bacterium]